MNVILSLPRNLALAVRESCSTMRARFLGKLGMTFFFEMTFFY